MSVVIKGLGVSEGLGIGRLLLLKPEVQPQEAFVDNVKVELNKLSDAIYKSLVELQAIYSEKLEKLGEEKAQIFQAHIMILKDPEWIKDIEAKIEAKKYEAQYSVHVSAEAMAQMFEQMDNEYFRERAHDIRDVARRIIRNLRGQEATDLSQAPKGTIVVAQDLTPSDTAQLKPENISGIVTAIGGKTSHSAIIARTLGIPAVMGIGMNNFESLTNQADAIINGQEGSLILNPDAKERACAKRLVKELSAEKESLKSLIGQSTYTKNERQVELAANIASPDDLKRVIENDAEGIGLFRSEFLFMDRNSAPSEEDQFKAYRSVLEGMNDKPVIIRTMDIGGDKEVSYLNMPKEMNPFLGYRAVRYCINEPQIFKIQMRALLRAGLYGNLKIMLPMISSVHEVRAVKEIIEGVKADLQAEGFPFNDSVPLGIMIEIPAAAIASDLLAKEVDFFSIGTNDLIQYTIAVDRMNESIADLYTAYHPAVLRLIKMTIENGHKAGIWVGMCGSVAGDLDLMPLLLGMELDEFSMSPANILKARKRALEIDTDSVKDHLDTVLSLATSEEVESYMKKNFPR
ncbi:phosphoenolpyruvate--protein phosphotransferase [Fusibacter sp. JL216-2]|uniref:phosphoenolpyruvate--protein phosphotransferase n=1 Tax=Fusibacter sp. JL216-2 TaxID=3071453 RepID=UPI003D3416A9